MIKFKKPGRGQPRLIYKRIGGVYAVIKDRVI